MENNAASSPHQESLAIRLRSAGIGQAIVPQVPILFLTTIVSALTTAALIAFLVFGAYTPRETVSGYLVPISGVTKVFPTQSGVVRKILVRDSENVHTGQPLVLVSLEQQLSGGGGVQSQSIEELHVQERQLGDRLANAKRLLTSDESRLDSRRAGLRAELDALKAEASAVNLRSRHEQNSLRRVEELHVQGFLSENDLEQARSRVLDLKRELSSLQRDIVANATAMREAEEEGASLPLKAQQQFSAIEERLSELRRQIAVAEGSREYALVAPVSGRVTGLQAELGKTVGQGQPLLAIVPPGEELVIHLLVPTRAIGFVKVGQEVRVRFDAFPYEKYGTYVAHATEVSTIAFSPSEWSAARPLGNEPMYRVTARLDRQTVKTDRGDASLQPSMLLSADIMLERRSIASWLFGPVFALSQW